MSDTGFDAFGLPAKLAQALARMKFTTPTPIQEQTIPLALKGHDVLGSAQTGTGKTGAFGIPVIAGLLNRPDSAALIMTPTRELASQVMAAIQPMIPSVDIRTALLIGGEAMPRQFHQLRNNPRLIVGTPGRINDHLERGSLKLGDVRFLVLDETDRMLDMGFGIQIERILKHVSADRQTLLFSATLPHNITKLSGKYMKDPVRVAVGSTSNPAANIKQEIIPTTDAEKYGKLLEQLANRKGSIIIFVKTKFGTEKLADKLTKADHRADAIHGDLQQRRRERVIQNFRDKKFRILVATDVAARGLDIPHIEHVINYDMPQAPEDYIHRIGRTARAGAEGEAISFLTGADNIKWRAIQRLMNGEDPNTPPARGSGSGARRGGPPRKQGGGFGARKPFFKRDGDRPAHDRGSEGHARPERSTSDRPAAERHGNDRPRSERSHSDRPRGDRPQSDRLQSDRPRSERASGERTYSDRPRGERSNDNRPSEKRASSDRPRHERSDERPRGERTERAKPYNPLASRGAGEGASSEKRHVPKAWGDKPRYERSASDKPRGERPIGEKSYGDKPRSDKPRGDAPRSDKGRTDKPRGDKPYGKKFGGSGGQSMGGKFGGSGKPFNRKPSKAN